jgi:hypothetical protein
MATLVFSNVAVGRPRLQNDARRSGAAAQAWSVQPACPHFKAYGLQSHPFFCLISLLGVAFCLPPPPDPEGLLMPALYGGRDGAELTRQLLSLGFPRAMMLVSGGQGLGGG